MCSIEGCELDTYKNMDKCILHCEKNDWYKDKENGHRDWSSSEEKIENFLSHLKNFINNRISITPIGLIKDKVINFKKVFFPKLNRDNFDNIFRLIRESRGNSGAIIQLSFEESEFLGNIDLSHLSINDNLYFYETKFKGKIDFNNANINGSIIFENNTEFNNEVTFLNAMINKKFEFKNCIVNSDINFEHAKFNKTVDFYNTKFNGTINFYKTDFQAISVFTETKFNANVDFKYTTFEKIAIFRDGEFNKKIDLRDSIFKDESNFLNIKINELNRETARIIKNSFEQQNNIMEANKFYALEMEEREKELNEDIKKGKNFFEWLVFKIHGVSSNHSQDWTLALFWIIVFGFGFSLIKFYMITENDKFIHFHSLSFLGVFLLILYGVWLDFISKKETEKKSFFFLFYLYLVYVYETKDIFLNYFTSVINPFSKYSNMTLIDLLCKIIIAYLIYQLIISIRQNTRRK